MLPAAQHKAAGPEEAGHWVCASNGEQTPSHAGWLSCRIVALEVMVLRLSKVEKLTGRKEKGWVQTIQNNTSALQICFLSCSCMLLGSVGLLERRMLLKVMW